MKKEIYHSRKPAATALFSDPNLRIIYGITLMAVLGVSSITPVFPKIQRVLNISPEAVGLLITAFTLPGFLLTPVLGVLADRYGRKKILVPSLLLFGLAGAACAFARNFHVLLLLRFLQGIGGASLGSLNVTLIGDMFSGEKQAAAMGYNASVLSVGTAGYPFIGGLVGTMGWHYPFLLPIISVPIGLFVLFRLKNPEPDGGQNLKEYLGNVWQTVKSWQVFGLFIASIATFVILYGSFLTYFPLLLGNSFGASPFIIGILTSSMSIATAFLSSQLGRLAKHFSKKALILIAFVFYGGALLLFPQIHHLWLFLIPAVIFGIGHGLNIPSIQTLLAGLAPIQHRGAFMSLNGMVLRFGQTIGPPLLALVLTLWGMNATFYFTAALSGLIFILVFLSV